jgi:hypothetical protein
MESSEFKNFLINSLNENADPEKVSEKLREAGVKYDFSNRFSEKILNKLFAEGVVITREIEFVRSMNFVFSRIALTGVAAIIFLIISIFLMEGSLSINSFLGLTDIHDESIVCLLTGK